MRTRLVVRRVLNMRNTTFRVRVTVVKHSINMCSGGTHARRPDDM